MNVAVKFLMQVIFLFPLFLGMVKLMYTNYEVETKEKSKLPELKIYSITTTCALDC